MSLREQRKRELKKLLVSKFGDNYKKIKNYNSKDIWELISSEKDYSNLKDFDPKKELKILRKPEIPEYCKKHLLEPIQQKKSFYKCPFADCKSDQTVIYEMPSMSTDEGSYEIIYCNVCNRSKAIR